MMNGVNGFRTSLTATELFTEFRQRIESPLGEFGELGGISDWAGKLPGAVARIAGLLHVAEYGLSGAIPDSISMSTMRSAIQIGEYFIGHATIAFAIMGRDESTAMAEHILRVIQKVVFDARQSGVEVANGTGAFCGHMRFAQTMPYAVKVIARVSRTQGSGGLCRSRPFLRLRHSLCYGLEITQTDSAE